MTLVSRFKRLLGFHTVAEAEPSNEQSLLPEFLIDTNSISLANPISHHALPAKLRRKLTVNGVSD